MKNRIVAVFLIIALLVTTVAMTGCDLFQQLDALKGADGKDGIDGADGKNGVDGITPKLRINEETNEWEVSYDNGVSWTSMGVKANGEKGDTGEQGPQGEKGDAGTNGVGIVNIEKIASEGKVDTYKITFSDGKSSTFTVTNGEDGKDVDEDAIKDLIDQALEEQLGRTPYDDGELTVLTIGSSYLMDATTYVYDLAKELGNCKIKVGNLYIGGCTIDEHLNCLTQNLSKYTYYEYENDGKTETLSYSIIDALQEREWDYIVLNQGAQESGIASTYANLGEYLGKIKEYCPKSKIAFMMSWTYSSLSTLPNFKKDFNSSVDEQYEGIVAAVKACVEPLGFDCIIPCGTAFKNARTSKLTEGELTRDPVSYGHGSTLGCYLVSLTLIAALTDLDVENIGFVPAGVTVEQKAIAVESCLNALKQPYSVISSQYR